jgi:hypothetical protein
MTIEKEKFEKAELKANQFYEKNRTISCPVLGDIKLTPAGMEHIRKKNKTIPRSLKEIYVRYKCFLNIKEVLTKMHYYQEYTVLTKDREERKNGKNVIVKKMVTYIAFIAIVKVGIDLNRIKIVVSKTQGKDNYEFVSIIPSRNNDSYRMFDSEDI